MPFWLNRHHVIALLVATVCLASLYLFVLTPHPYLPAIKMAAASSPTEAPPLPTELSALGAEYQRLRTLPGHMQATPSAWNADVDAFGGRKHGVMRALGDRLGVAGTPAASILTTMGKPDNILPATDAHSVAGGKLDIVGLGDSGGAVVGMMPGPVVPSDTPMPKAGGMFLVYYWRGKHDYLWFEAGGEDDSVVSSGWYNAAE